MWMEPLQAAGGMGSAVASTIVLLNDIPDQGLILDLDLSQDELSLSSEDAHLQGSVHTSLTLQRDARRLDVHGYLTATFIDECVRCLKQSERAAHIPVSAQYWAREPQGRGRHSRKEDETGEAAGLSGPESEDDLYVVSGDQVDLAEMLREHVILSLPMQPLCSESCRGLCPVCGRDRNERDCGCREVRQQNPFSVLQERFKKHE